MAEPTAPTSNAVVSRRRLLTIQITTVITILAAIAAAVWLRDRVQELRQYGYAAVFLVGLISNATVILPVPGLAVTAVLGSVFNPWIVGLVGGVGQTLGELTGYMAGYSGHPLVDNYRLYNRLTRWMQRYGAIVIFALALIPNPAFDLGGIAAGALRFSWRRFLLSCAAGKIIKNISIALAAYHGSEIIVRWLGG